MKKCGIQTNNVAELNAIDKAFNILKKYINTTKQIKLYTDSLYAIRCLTSYGEKLENNSWDSEKEIPNIDLVKYMYNKFKNINNIELIHIKAHTNKKDEHSLGNKQADILAYNALL